MPIRINSRKASEKSFFLHILIVFSAANNLSIFANIIALMVQIIIIMQNIL